MPPQVRPSDTGVPVSSQAPVQIEQSKTTETDKKATPEQPKQNAETAAKNAEGARQHAAGTIQTEIARANFLKDQLDKKLKDENAGKTDKGTKSATSKEEATALVKKVHDEAMKAVNAAKAVEVAKNVNVQIIKTSLEVSDTKNLKKRIAESEKLPEENRKIFNEAMGHSEIVMKKVAKEFTPDEQLKVIDRSYEMDKAQDKQHRSALKTWMDNTKSSTLDHVFKNSSHYLELEIAQQVHDGDVGNFKKLNSENKIRVAELVIGDSSSPDVAIQQTFENINPKEKNILIDKIQVGNPDSQLDFMKISAKSLDHNFMEGIDKNNGEFMRKTYSYMASNAKIPEEKDLYNKNALYLENWMDEKFKR